MLRLLQCITIVHGNISKPKNCSQKVIARTTTIDYQVQVEQSISVCVCVCVCVSVCFCVCVSFELTDIWPACLTCWLTLTFCMSRAEVKAVGQSSRSREEKKELSICCWMANCGWIAGHQAESWRSATMLLKRSVRPRVRACVVSLMNLSHVGCCGITTKVYSLFLLVFLLVVAVYSCKVDKWTLTWQVFSCG